VPLPEVLGTRRGEGTRQGSSRRWFGGIVPPALLDGADFAHELLLRGRPMGVSSQASELRERKIGITPFDCPCDNGSGVVPVLRTGTEQQQSTAPVGDGQAFARSHSVSRAEGASDAA